MPRGDRDRGAKRVAYANPRDWHLAKTPNQQPLTCTESLELLERVEFSEQFDTDCTTLCTDPHCD